MRGAVLLAAAVLLLGAPATAVAQEGSPFGPIAPAAPPAEAQAPQPTPQPTPQPAGQMPRVAPEDESLSLIETLPLLGISIALFVAVGVAIARDARRPSSRRKRVLTRRSSRGHRAGLRS